MAIAKRKRSVKFVNGYPTVMVRGKRRMVTDIVTKGTDNPKTLKNLDGTFFPLGTTLSPAKSAGVGNVCAHAGKCADTCLDETGMGAFKGSLGDMIHGARIARTVVFYKARDWFLEQQQQQLRAFVTQQAKKGLSVCYRPNMLSDIAWETFGVPQAHPDIQMYDYTKDPRRVGQVCPNYWVTFSRDSAKDDGLCIELLQQGLNVAIAFDDGYTTGARNLHGSGPLAMPKEWNGFPVFNGDEDDARWRDPRGHVIGLVLKSANMNKRKAAIESGFAVLGEQR
jgi:hypothetical protein